MSGNGTTPPATQPPEVVSEADKPFILVLILLAAVLGLLLFTFYEKVYDQAKDVILILVGTLTTGFGYYFKAKTT